MIAIEERRTQPGPDPLAERLRQGDPNAFGHVFRLYEQNVYRYAYYLLGHAEDAADVTQETFLKAYLAIGTFRGNASLLTWLLRICINLCRDRLRSRKSHTILCEYAAHDLLENAGNSRQPLSPYASVEQSQTVAAILRALQGLSPAQREIIILHEIEGLEYAEIARALGCTAPTARMRLFRARHLLKERVVAMLESGTHDGKEAEQ